MSDQQGAGDGPGGSWATGRPVMVSHVPAIGVCLCGWNPELQSANVLIQPPPSIFSGGCF